MTIEQLKRGRELAQNIEDLKENLENWQRAAAFDGWALSLASENRASIRVKSEFVNFTLLRTVTISSLEEAIRKAEAELAAL
jgi:hypothetical protein